MSVYESIAKVELEKHGFTPASLINNHDRQLKLLRIEADLGIIDIPKKETPEDPMDLTSVSIYWIDKACQWPYQDEVHGIALKDALVEAAFQIFANPNSYQVTVMTHAIGNNWSLCVAKALCKADKEALKKIPQKFLFDEMIDEALSFHGGQISSIDKNLINEKRLLLAFENSPHSIMNVDDEYLTDKAIDLCISKDGVTLSYLSSSRITEYRILKAIETAPHVISFMGDDQLTKKIVKEAAKRDGLVVGEVSHKYVDTAICKIAVKSNPYSLCLIPNSLVSKDLLNVVKKQFPSVYEEDWFKAISETQTLDRNCSGNFIDR